MLTQLQARTPAGPSLAFSGRGGKAATAFFGRRRKRAFAGPDAARIALVEGTPSPILLVRAGLRPGGLAPEHTLTRFTWSIADG